MGIWQEIWRSLRGGAKTRPPKDLVAEPSAHGSRSILSSWPSKGLDPERLTAILEAAAAGDPYEQCELFEEMLEKDQELLGRYLDRLRPVAMAPFVVQPGEPEDPRSVRAAQDAEDLLVGLGWRFRQALWWLLDAVGKSYAAVEVSWRTGPAGVVPVAFHWRHGKWFRPDATTGSQLRVITTSSPVEGEPMLPGQFLVMTYTPLTGLVARGGLFRPLAWVYLFRIFALKGWVQLLEILGIPLRLGRYPRGAHPAEVTVLEQALENLGRDAWAAIPEDMKVELLQTLQKEGGSNHLDLVEWAAEAYALLLLGQNLTSRSGERGARSLGEVHWAVKQEIKRGDGTQLEAVISDQLLAPWCAWNYGAEVAPPRLVLQLDDPEDLGALSERDERLQRMGYPITRRYIQEAYGLPEQREDDEILAVRGAAVEPPGEIREPTVSAELDGRPVSAAAGTGEPSGDRVRPPAPEPDETELVDAMVARAAAAWSPLRSGLLGAVREATSYVAARKALESVQRAGRPAIEAWALRGMTAAYVRAWAASHRRRSVAAGMPLPEGLSALPNVGELRALALREGMTAGEYYRLDATMRARAFTIGGIENLAAVRAVKDSIIRAEQGGVGYAEWLDGADQILDRHGLAPLNPYRAQIVYRNAVRQAQMAARWDEELSPEAMADAPYWMYDAIADDRTRETHRMMDGFVALKTDPIWQRWFPPNDHQCRCSVIELSQDQVNAMELTVRTGDEIDIVPAWPNPPSESLAQGLRSYSDEDLEAAYGPILGEGDPQEVTWWLQRQDGRTLVESDVLIDQLRRGMVQLGQLGIDEALVAVSRGGLRSAAPLIEAAETQAILDVRGGEATVAHVEALDQVLARMRVRLAEIVPEAQEASPATMVRALYPPEREAEIRAVLGITDEADDALAERLRGVLEAAE